MKRKNIIRLVSLLSAGILVAGGFALKFHCQKEYLGEQIENRYMNSLSQFGEMISQIDTDLKKQKYANDSTMKTMLSGDILKNSATAKICLGELPISEENAEGIYKYLATVGDFSRVASLSDNKKSDQGLSKLIEFSEQLNTDIDLLINKISDKKVFKEDIENLLNSLSLKTSFSTEFEDISQISKTFPTLIYDGPFSDHINRLKPRFLENKGSITEAQAKKIASGIFNQSYISFTGEENSQISCYIYENDLSVCAITKKGGIPLYYYNYSNAGKQKISVEKAVNKAKRFAKKVFKKDFKESYYDISDNILTVNLAVENNNTVYYSDLVKIGIYLKNGNIRSVEARGFIMNNHERDNTDFNADEKKIKSVVNKSLKIESISKAVILDNALKEKYCFEIKCKTDEKNDIIIYLNKDTLKEENILFLIHSDNGVLTK